MEILIIIALVVPLLFGLLLGMIRGSRRATLRILLVILCLVLAFCFKDMLTVKFMEVQLADGNTIGQIVADNLPAEIAELGDEVVMPIITLFMSAMAFLVAF